MKEIIAHCGLACHECGAFIAKRDNDNQKRIETAESWSKIFQAGIKPENINCDGCLSQSGEIMDHCKTCEVRICCMEKEIENCGYCKDYACDKLTGIFEYKPEAKERMDAIAATQ